MSGAKDSFSVQGGLGKALPVLLRRGFLPGAIASGLLLAGCGGSSGRSGASGAMVTVPGSALTGNWLLQGELPQFGQFSRPGVAVALNVESGVLTGTADILTTCGKGSASVSYGAIFPPGLTGTIQNDDTFSVSTTPDSFTPALRITGVAPASPGMPWKGSYTLTGSIGPLCALNDSGDFEATPFGDVTGTYVGASLPVAQSANGGPAGAGLAGATVGVTMNLHQGALLHEPNRPMDGTETHLALDGSLQISGTSCFSKGSISTASPSQVQGNEVSPVFVMDDGSTLYVTGAVTDAAADSLALTLLNVRGGLCDGVYFIGPNAILHR